MLEDNSYKNKLRKQQNNVDYLNKSPIICKQIRKFTDRKQKQKAQYQQIQSFFIYKQPHQNQYFHLNGDFFVYFSSSTYSQEFYETITKCMTQIETFDKYISAKMPTIELIKDFHIPIQLLEKSQNQEKYELAQQLKIFQGISKQVIDNFRCIVQEYSFNIEDLKAINEQRAQFRKRLINDYINTKLTNEDFYYIGDIGINLEFLQIEIKYLNISKALLSLIGVDEKEATQYLLHVGLNEFTFLSQFEKYYKAVIDMIQNQKIREYKFKDFIIITLDDFKIYSDINVHILDINYPQELQFQGKNNNLLDHIIIFSYDIQIHHLKYLIEKRCQNNVQKEFDLDHSKSFEYSLLSQILIDRYYPDKTQHFKTITQEIESIHVNKQCGYKFIS